MLFYRVERDGQGPYTSYDFSTERELGVMLDDHGWRNPHNHPTPYQDEGIMNRFRTYVHVCGFISFEKMIDWFDGWGDALDKYDFRVKVYSVFSSDVITGQFQDVVVAEALEEIVDEFSPAGM